MKVKPSIPKGMRDFSPQEVQKRNYIFNTIRPIFEKYGYQPIETPTMENRNVLLGKYGEEGDKLVFNVLNSGNYLKTIPEDRWKEIKKPRKPDKLHPAHFQTLTQHITEKCLRYDLTVPFARYVAMHQNEITFPFKRYQIQPVWRADRPQKGRYREFYQCDADVIGSDSLLNEVELIQILDEGFSNLGLDVTIHVNHRKVFSLIAILCNEDYSNPKITSKIVKYLDQIDKVGLTEVISKLREEFPNANPGLSLALEKIYFSSDFQSVYEIVAKTSSTNLIEEDAQLSKIKQDIETLNAWINNVVDTKNTVKLSPLLARGLDYYTGTIFEVTANDAEMGSIAGGGRYDNLTGMFGLEGVSGVGISFGVERIYDVMEELGLFPEEQLTGTQALFVNFGGESERQSFRYLQQLRQEGVRSEIFPDPVKLKKQMKYANNNSIPFVVMIGEEELALGKLKLKDMESGKEELLAIEELIHKLVA